MPKIDIASITPRLGSSYPVAFKAPIVGREKYALGDAAGLTQFGVNLTRLKPGAASSLRHWHENEDELIFVLEGEMVLIEDGGETLLRPGDAAGFKAGVANGHQLVNKFARALSRRGSGRAKGRARFPLHQEIRRTLSRLRRPAGELR